MIQCLLSGTESKQILAQAVQSVQPSFTTSLQCTALIIDIFQEIHWIAVPCNSTINTSASACTLVCQKECYFSDFNRTDLAPLYCQNVYWVQFLGGCYNVSRELTAAKNSRNCSKIKSHTEMKFTKLKHLLSSHGPYGSLITFTIHTEKLYFQCRENIQYNLISVKETKPNDFRVSDSELFACKNEEFISPSLVCDEQNDCSNGYDEVHCICRSDNSQTRFCSKTCILETCFCTALFKPNGAHGECSPYVDMKSHNTTNTDTDGFNELYHCSDNTTISVKYMNDLIPDCQSGEDEVWWKYSQADLLHYCQEPHMIPCDVESNSTRCFFFHQLCAYALDRNMQLMHCRNGAHLSQCETFNCSGYFKCQQSYCIDHSSVCNGKWDCPLGYEEIVCTSTMCKGLLKCKHSKKCVHINRVCDGNLDCPEEEDESLCDLSICPTTCTCLARAMLCIKATLLNAVIDNFFAVTITRSKIEIQGILISNCQYLNISDNNIILSCMSNEDLLLPNLVMLDFSQNCIHTLTDKCFKYFKLRTLKLKSSKIHFVSDYAFVHLKELKNLDLSFNLISSITEQTFSGLQSMRYLLLHGNEITEFAELTSKDALPDMILVLVDNPLICCLNISCQTSQNEDHMLPVSISFHEDTQLLNTPTKTNHSGFDNSHCNALLPKKVLKVCVPLLSVFVLLTNTIATVVTIIDTRRQNEKNRSKKTGKCSYLLFSIFFWTPHNCLFDNSYSS